jgi:hypothetical protein
MPELGVIAGTRVALGLGAGLLLSSKLSGSKRLGVGWTLLAIGALTTIPLFLRIRRKPQILAA